MIVITTPVVDEEVVPDVPVESTVGSLQVTMTGVDGSTWDLTNGPVGLVPGPQVFAAPSVGHWWRDTPVADGSRWDGMRTGRRDLVVPVEVSAPSWRQFRDLDAAFFRAIHPSGECVFTVTTPDAQVRSLSARFVAGGDVDSDPLLFQVATYTLEFTAANPFWLGEPTVSTPLPIVSPRAMFRGHTDLTQPGPFLPINLSRSSDSATISNPGEEPVWPTYTITGPMTTWQVGVGDALIASSQPLTAGRSVTIQTDPFSLEVVDQDGNDVYEYLTRDDFAAIPAGTDVVMKRTVSGINVSAGSQLLVEFAPLYRRPW